MPIERVYTTVYYVADWDVAVAFYRDTLGLKRLAVEQGWGEFEGGKGGRIALHARSTEHHGASATHVSLQVRDLEGTVAELKRKGARVAEPVRHEEFGALASVTDPSGNLIGLFEPK